jgi:hypothetical protein
VGPHVRLAVEAYQFAFGANLIVQLLALVWFLLSPIEVRLPERRKRVRIPRLLHAHPGPSPICRYRAARKDWLVRTAAARVQAEDWRTVALMSMSLCIVLGTLVVSR